MGSKRDTQPTQTKEPKHSGVSKAPKITQDQLGSHLAETAWRVALPFMFFSLGGIWLDNRLLTEPLYSIIGVLLGLTGASLAVYRFVIKHYPDTFKSPKGDE